MCFALAFFLCLAQRADRKLEWNVRVVPVDQQKVDVWQLQIGQALLQHLGERIGHQVALAYLRADEYVLAPEARLAQALAVLRLVAIEGGGVEVTVPNLQSRFDRLYADIVFQCHGAEDRSSECGRHELQSLALQSP